jgi:hypothetical protein
MRCAVRDAPLVEVALRGALVQPPARRIADPGDGLRVTHQQHRAGPQLTQQRLVRGRDGRGAAGGESGQHLTSGERIGHPAKRTREDDSM